MIFVDGDIINDAMLLRKATQNSCNVSACTVFFWLFVIQRCFLLELLFSSFSFVFEKFNPGDYDSYINMFQSPKLKFKVLMSSCKHVEYHICVKIFQCSVPVQMFGEKKNEIYNKSRGLFLFTSSLLSALKSGFTDFFFIYSSNFMCWLFPGD